jgi:hypothetical protein
MDISSKWNEFFPLSSLNRDVAILPIDGILEEPRLKGFRMSLKSTLLQLKTSSRSTLPEDVVAIMTRATDHLIDSGIVRMALGIGKPAPSFILPDCQGIEFSSSDLLAQGPLVLSFYRGSW